MRRFQIIKLGIPLILFGLVLLIVSCAVNPVTGQRELMLLSEADEVRLGQQTDIQVIQTYGIYDDASLSSYIENMGQQLAKLSHRPQLDYHFKILDAPAINAFAVPGGYVYLTRGILSYLNSEAELAGVMGHEIGHITARHTARQYSRVQLARLGLGVGTVLSRDFRNLAGLAEFGTGLLFLKFSRDNERQSDELGVEYATRAGYDASQMANFFETLERLHPSEERSGLPGWLSTHPSPEGRVEAVGDKAQEWRQKLGVQELEINRDAYLRKIDGLVFGEDPRQGYVEDHVFYHPTLKFQFPVPADWKLNNTASQVQMINEKRDAVILFMLGSGNSPEEAARKFIADTKARVLRFERISVNSLLAQRLISDIISQRGTIRVMSYFIQKDSHIYVFHGFTGRDQFERYRSTFQSTMDQFKNLTDLEKIHVEPARVRVRATQVAGTLQETLRSLGVPDEKLEEMALLNGKHLSDLILVNTLLKVVVEGNSIS